MKRWQFSTVFLSIILVGLIVLYLSPQGYAQSDDDGGPMIDFSCGVDGGLYCCTASDCEQPEPPHDLVWCQGSHGGDNCEDCGGTCQYEVCCFGPGCGPGCAPPGCFNGEWDWWDPWNEECDESSPDSPPGECQFCHFVECGNGIVQDLGGEQCDDGNTEDGDGCSSTCQLEGGAWCGNGGTCTDNADCDAGQTCSPEQYCVEAGEECDDGNDVDGDGCSSCILDIPDDQYQCDESQRILRINSDTNAHGELYNGAGDYQIDICFDEIFGYEHIDAGDPHACTGDNLVLRLSSDTNAHGETPDSDIYSSDVCFGNLVCRGIPADQTCSAGAGEEEIVLLSGQTNAHIETRDAEAYEPPYNGGYRICCSDGGTPPDGDISAAEWQDASGMEIDVTYLNRTVFLTAETNLASGTVDFFVWDDDDNDGEYSAIPDDSITLLTAPIVDGTATTSLYISESIIEDADDGLDCNNGLEFYFNASVGDSSLVSDLLTVNCELGPNDPPTAVISGPEHRQIYFNSTTILFNGTGSYDPEGGPLEFLWTVEFENQIEFTETQALFEHNFTQPGMRTITLRVTDDTGQWDEEQIAILVVASPYMLAYINDPFHQEVIQEPGEPPTTTFSATHTYIVDSLPDADGDNCPEVFCLGGFCPPTVVGPPPGCDSLIVTGAPTDEDSADYTNLFFNWTFGQDGEQISNFGGFDNVSGWKSYSLPSDQQDDKWIDLTVLYDEGGENETIETTDRIFTLGQCISGGSEFIETDGNGNFIRTHGTMAGDADPSWCSGGDGVINGNECCPIGFTCNLNPGDGPIGCIGSIDNVNECSDYSNEGNCTADPYGVGSPSNPIYEPLVDSCEADGGTADIDCVWNTTESECYAQLACEQDSCVGDDCGNPACTHYLCEYDYPESECVNGYLTIEYIVTGFTPGTCPDSPADASVCDKEPVTVPCGRLNFELHFFDYMQLGITAALILVIYTIMHLTNSMTLRRKQ